LEEISPTERFLVRGRRKWGMEKSCLVLEPHRRAEIGLLKSRIGVKNALAVLEREREKQWARDIFFINGPLSLEKDQDSGEK